MFGLLPFNRKEISILSLCWTHLIFYGCTIPGTEIPEVRFDFIIQLDKLIHFFFFFLFFLFWSGVRRYTTPYGLFLVGLACAYGLFIEYFQFNFVDGRGFELADLLADGLGALSCFLLRPFIAPLVIRNIDKY
jgi:VanZ family protein